MGSAKPAEKLWKQFGDVHKQSIEAIGFTNWFGTSVEKLKKIAAEKPATDIQKLLIPVVKAINSLIADIEEIQLDVYIDFLEQRSNRKEEFPNINQIKVQSKMKVASPETLEKMQQNLTNMKTKMKKFVESIRNIEQAFINQLFNNKFNDVKKALDVLAEFVSKKPSPKAADIQKETKTVQNSIITPIKNAVKNKRKDHLTRTLIEDIEEAFGAYYAKLKEEEDAMLSQNKKNI